MTGGASSRLERQRLISRLQTASGPQSSSLPQDRPILSQRLTSAPVTIHKAAVSAKVLPLQTCLDAFRSRDEASPAWWTLIKGSFDCAEAPRFGPRSSGLRAVLSKLRASGARKTASNEPDAHESCSPDRHAMEH